MENPAKMLDPIIRKRIDLLNETVERSVEYANKVVENESYFQLLKSVLSDDHLDVLLKIYDNYCFKIIDTEDIYYRKGFVDGMQLQQEINLLGGRE